MENNYSIPFEVDYGAMERSLRSENDLQNDPGYKEWIENTFADLIVDRGIPNGVDLFTPSGNRRSFKARHIPATLENIVRQMKKEQERGIGVLGINLRGAATKSYSSVEEMRSESGKLLGTQINDDVYDSYMKAFYERFHELGSQASKSKDWSQIDSAEEILLEAVRDSKSKAQMDSKLRKEAQWINYSEELTDDLWQLRNDVQNMPAPYFEAKPRRIVYPNEALAYILPDNADPDVIKQLQDNNYNVMTYKAGDEQDRLAKVNSVEGSQFQMYDETANDSLFEAEERQKAWEDLQAENAILEDTVTQLRKEIEKLTEKAAQLNLTDKPEVRMNDAQKMARQIIRDTRPEPITTRDKAEIRDLTKDLAKRIKEIGDYILETGKNPNEIDYSELRSMAQEIARDIVDNASVEIDDGGYTKDMRDQMRAALKNRAIFVPEQYRSDVLDWNDFKKRYRNIFTFKDSGTDIDIVYQSLLEEIPGLLDPNINNPGDMLNELADKWDLLQPKYENPFDDFTSEAINHYTNMILQGALDGTLRQIAPTYADKMNARIEEVRNQGKEKVKEAEQQGKARLEALRAEKNARIEEIRQQGIARKEEALAKERAAKWDKVAATRQYYQEMAERAATRRKNSETKTKIKSLINDLNSRLTHPTEKKYVPAHLVENTIRILEMIDLDSGRDGVKLQERIALLQQQYAALKNDTTFAGYAYDPVMEEGITNMARAIGATPLRNMNSSQLETVYNTLKTLETVIRTSVKDTLYGEEWNFYETARAAVKATRDAAGTRNNALGNAADWYITNTMRPEVVFERFGGYAKGSEWEQIYQLLDKAQRYGMDLQMKFAKNFEDLLKDKKQLAKLTSTKAEDLLDIGLKDETGETIKVTRDFALFVYMNLFNEDNIQHVMRGGIEVPELKEYLNGKGDRGYGKGSRRAVGISNRLSDINHAIEDSTDATEKA